MLGFSSRSHFEANISALVQWLSVGVASCQGFLIMPIAFLAAIHLWWVGVRQGIRIVGEADTKTVLVSFSGDGNGILLRLFPNNMIWWCIYFWFQNYLIQFGANNTWPYKSKNREASTSNSSFVSTTTTTPFALHGAYVIKCSQFLPHAWQATQATFKSIKSLFPLLDRVLVQRFKPETVRVLLFGGVQPWYSS